MSTGKLQIWHSISELLLTRYANKSSVVRSAPTGKCFATGADRSSGNKHPRQRWEWIWLERWTIVSLRTLSFLPGISSTENSWCRVSLAFDVYEQKKFTHSVEFSVGKHQLSEFRMIERHYFKNKLLKSFDFNFGFVIPESINSVEHIYELPKLSDKESWLVKLCLNLVVILSSSRNSSSPIWNTVGQLLLRRWQTGDA